MTTLVYWGILARNVNPLLLSGITENEIKVDSDTANTWPAPKAQCPFGQLPLLKENGKTVAQSAAIDIYLAAKFGMSTEGLDYARSLMIYMQSRDMFDALGKAKYGEGDERKNYLDLFSGAMKTGMGQLNALMGEGKFFGGDSVSLGDVGVFGLLYVISRMSEEDLLSGLLEGNDALSAWWAACNEDAGFQRGVALIAQYGPYFKLPAAQ